MLKLTFYSKGTEPFGKEITNEWAMIFCEKDDYDDEFETEKNLENNFTKGDLNFKKVPVFESDTIFLNQVTNNISENIENIVEKEKPEVILISTMNFFKRAIHFSKREEMEPKMIVTENRDIVYYAMIGRNKSALIVAWDCYVDPKEETED